MAISKQDLLKLLNNPGMFNPAEAQDEEEVAPEAAAPDLSELPGLEDAEAPAPEEMLGEEEPEAEEIASIPQPDIAPESDITSKLRKLRATQMGMPEEEEVNEEDAGDPEADLERRKAAIQKIKQKYLGQ